MTKTTSMRFTDDELALLDIIAKISFDRTGIRHSRTDVVRMLLKRTKPSDELGTLHAAHRTTYNKAFTQ